MKKKLDAVKKFICLLNFLVKLSICLIISPLPCLHDIICYYQVWSIAVYASLNPSTRRNVWRTNAPHF